MSLRTFASPRHSIDAAITTNGNASGEIHVNGMAEANGQERSTAAAQQATDSFSKNEKEPLAAQKPKLSKPGITFAAQDNLPKLPIPDLDQSCKRFLQALEPLQTTREYDDTVSAVNEFLKSEGPELQERLKRYATSKSSYIEQFWYDSYLNYDNPVVLNLNPFFLLEDDPTPARNNQVTRAASLVISSLCFVRAVRKEELPPDMIRNQPLCMYQYSRLFGTARIPTDAGCQIAQDPQSKHIVVICRGQFYWFDVLDDSNELIVSEENVAQNLEAIVEDAEQIPVLEAARGAVGVLSTENRKIWSGLRDVISRDEGSNNSDCLNIVDSALFIMCLDDTEPRNQSDLCMNMLCGTSMIERGVQTGTCTNRWYDKLQIIVCKNGSAGINFEHTGVDGHTVLRFASDVYTDTILRFARSINGLAPSLWASTSPDPKKRDPKTFGAVSLAPHKLEWDMTPELTTALRFAETRLADLIQQNEFAVLEFKGYGKQFMTSMGFSPDAFVQMAYQAAYYGLYGRMECMYEPAMTKVFFHGRTEAIRQVTLESSAFVKTFWGENPAKVKVEALRKACEKHSAITKECAKAQGHDRHLYALFCVWQRALDEMHGAGSNGFSSPADGGSSIGSPNRNSMVSLSEDSSQSPIRMQNGNIPQHMPSLFADAGWDKINTTILSTSNCGNPSLRQFGFGPTSGDGFGIGYIIKDGSVSICASSKHRQTQRFVAAIESYFLEIRKLLRQTADRQQTIPFYQRVSESQKKNENGGHERAKSRGRKILGHEGGKTPQVEEPEEEDDDGLGGYGFFDAGMLLLSLKEKEEKPSEKATAARRSVGKKLNMGDL